MIFLLLKSGFRHRPLRSLLTSLAMALSVSLVVAITSGMSSLESSARSFFSRFLGSVDITLQAVDQRREGFPESSVAWVRSDPRVRAVTLRLEAEAPLLTENGPPVSVIGIDPASDYLAGSVDLEAGRWFTRADAPEMLLDQVAAEKLKLSVGADVLFPSAKGEVRLKLVGIVHKPAILAYSIQTAYVPLRTFQAIANRPGRVTKAQVQLVDSAQSRSVAESWAPRLKLAEPSLSAKTQVQRQEEMTRNMQLLHLAGVLAGGITMICAGFLVYATLSMGVAERARVIGMMRCVGLGRWNLGLLVVLEGLILCVVGAIIGVLVGWLGLVLLARAYADLFTQGVVVDRVGVLLAVAGTLVFGLTSSFLPAWRAVTARPLESLTLQTVPQRAGAYGLWTLAGGLLVAGGLLLPTLSIARDYRFWLGLTVCVPAVIVGLVMLVPLAVKLSEWTFSSLISKVVGVPSVLVRHQVSRDMRRVTGTVAALAAGLIVLVFLNARGNSMLAAWRLPKNFPDIFIFAPSGLDSAAQQKLAAMPEFRRVMPMAVCSPQLGSGFFALTGLAFMPNATLFLGFDPDMGLQMLELDFRQGSAAEATAMLKKGRHIIVTEELARLKGYKVGDKMEMRTPNAGTVAYTIAGVVWSPGMDVLVHMFDMGHAFEQRTIATVFGNYEDAQKDFGVKNAYILMADLQLGVNRVELEKQAARNLKTMGLFGGDVRHIKANIEQGFRKLLMMISLIGVAAMVVSSFGVANTMAASIASRKWQFGVLRSIGLGRFQLARIVVAEALLLGLPACAIGITGGLALAHLSALIGETAVGFHTRLVIPWDVAIAGSLATFAICIAVGGVSAAIVSRARPLSLLQAGRASA